MLYSFKESRKTLIMQNFDDDLHKFLYSTYLSYLPENNFGYNLKMIRDKRGWLTEFIKSKEFGQIFISQTKPGITRGNHWHHTKVEKFLVIQGEAVIKFRNIKNEDIIEYKK
jgi:UDP-2-acetamido-2,6-beta-L-arabino-hexul-4-ose reductase